MSKLPWFRAYTEMVDDEKLRLLAFEDRWHFVAILCLKGQGMLDNNDPLLARKVAVKMGVDMRTLDEVVRRLAEVGLIDEETMQPIAWDDRQMRSDIDPTNAERQRRYRESKKSNTSAAKNNSNDTRNALHNATVTPLEEDTDTDIDIEDKQLRSVAPDDDPFNHAWSAYPKRAGGNSKAAARKAWDARLKAGVSADDMLDGVRRYAAYCAATSREGTQFVRQASTFFGPDLHFEDDFDIPIEAAKPQTNADRNADWNARMSQVISQSSEPQRQPMKDMGKINANN